MQPHLLGYILLFLQLKNKKSWFSVLLLELCQNYYNVKMMWAKYSHDIWQEKSIQYYGNKIWWNFSKLLDFRSLDLLFLISGSFMFGTLLMVFLSAPLKGWFLFFLFSFFFCFFYLFSLSQHVPNLMETSCLYHGIKS